MLSVQGTIFVLPFLAAIPDYKLRKTSLCFAPVKIFLQEFKVESKTEDFDHISLSRYLIQFKDLNFPKDFAAAKPINLSVNKNQDKMGFNHGKLETIP